MSFWVQVEEDTGNLKTLDAGAGRGWVEDVQFSYGCWLHDSNLEAVEDCMGSDLSYFSPQGEGGTRPALAPLPIRAEDLGLQVHTP